MGVIVFLIASIAIFLFSFHFFRDLSRISSRREPFALGYPRASMPVEPLVTPVDEVKSSERLPQIELDFTSIAAPTPVVDRSTEVSSFTITPSKTEESLLFRSLTLGMFALAVISVDLAAGTHYSGVGIPVTTMGAVWSWYRRHHPRHWLNIAVSVGSLAIVCGCLVPILASQMQIATDLVAPSVKMSTMLELALGMILVALQMGLSFNLYHRRLLGYCLVTSGVLMAVAASLSHDLSFLILLCGFIAIAIPALMLDYRSRLAL